MAALAGLGRLDFPKRKWRPMASIRPNWQAHDSGRTMTQLAPGDEE